MSRPDSIAFLLMLICNIRNIYLIESMVICVLKFNIITILGSRKKYVYPSELLATLFLFTYMYFILAPHLLLNVYLNLIYFNIYIYTRFFG